MNYTNKVWDEFERFHKHINEASPLEDIDSILELSKFGRKLGLKIPLISTFRVRFVSNMHYDWLSRANRMFKIISKIPNYEPRVKRFFNNDDIFDSLAALYELELAVRFKIQGFDVVFSDEKPPDKTPDMEINFSNKVFNLEVTTLNNPTEDQEKMSFYMKLNRIMFTQKIHMAGNLIRIPKQKQNELLEEIEENAKESITTGKKKIIVKEGAIVLEIVPWEKASELTFQGVHIVYKEKKNLVDKINQTIIDKQDQLNANQNPGILCIYEGSRLVNVEELYTKSYDKIYPHLQTYPNLSAIAISSYSDFYPTESLNHLEPQKNSKIFKTIKPAFGEREHSIIWKNTVAHVQLPEEFIRSYDYFEKRIEEEL